MKSRALLAAVVGAAFVAGCGSTSAPRASAVSTTLTKPNPVRFLHVDAARRAVTLTLIAADGNENNGFNLDGYSRGELLISVPRGWHVTVNCRNAGPFRNSCAVVSGPLAAAPAFAGAATPDPATGLSSGETATFSFVASRTGVYRIASVVPGHERARQYVVLEVTRTGRPAISARQGP